VPGNRFNEPAPPITNDPEIPPVELVLRVSVPFFVRRPLIAIVNDPEPSFIPNPAPETVMDAPLGPEVGVRVMVAAALAESISMGEAIDMSSMKAKIVAFVAVCIL